MKRGMMGAGDLKYRYRENQAFVGRSQVRGAGFGAFAFYAGARGDRIVEDGALVLPWREVGDELLRYVFEWDDNHYALAMGTISFLNHSLDPNLVIHMDAKRGCVTAYALRDIVAGEELFINYNGDPTCQDESWLPFKSKRAQR